MKLPDIPITPRILPGRKLQNVKELLELLGVDASQWRNFYQDRPFDSGDEEYINRILIRMPRVDANGCTAIHGATGNRKK